MSIDKDLPHRTARDTGVLRWWVEHVPGATTHVSLVGELDLASSDEVSSSLTEAVSFGEDVIVDMAGLTFIDSTGIAALVGAEKAAAACGCSLRLRHPRSNVLKTLRIVALDKVCDIEP